MNNMWLDILNHHQSLEIDSILDNYHMYHYIVDIHLHCIPTMHELLLNTNHYLLYIQFLHYHHQFYLHILVQHYNNNFPILQINHHIYFHIQYQMLLFFHYYMYQHYHHNHNHYHHHYYYHYYHLVVDLVHSNLLVLVLGLECPKLVEVMVWVLANLLDEV